MPGDILARLRNAGKIADRHVAHVAKIWPEPPGKHDLLVVGAYDFKIVVISPADETHLYRGRQISPVINID